MRLIDADALKIELAILHGGDYKTIHYLNHARTVDAVPVIRCKDCKFCKKYYHGAESNLGMFTYECIRGLYTVTADDFCSLAERKTE